MMVKKMLVVNMIIMPMIMIIMIIMIMINSIITIILNIIMAAASAVCWVVDDERSVLEMDTKSHHTPEHHR